MVWLRSKFFMGIAEEKYSSVLWLSLGYEKLKKREDWGSEETKDQVGWWEPESRSLYSII